MRLVDTSAWIEWLIGSPTGERVAAHLPEQSEWLVPTMVQLELSKWLTREVGEDAEVGAIIDHQQAHAGLQRAFGYGRTIHRHQRLRCRSIDRQ